MLKLLKDICAEALEAAGYDDLAKWVRDAPRQALRKVVQIVMRALGFKGKIDKKDADEIAKLKEQAEAKGPAPEAEEEEDDSTLTAYLMALNGIIAAGSQRRHLLLDGFLHTDDCASLWIFDREKSKAGIELDLKTLNEKEPYTILSNAGVDIYLLKKIDRDKLLELNERLGAGRDLPAELSTEGKPRVQFIYEHRIKTSKQTITRKPASGNRVREIRKDVDEELEISEKHEGLAAMFASLRPALEAVAKHSDALRKTVKDGLKDVAPNKKGKKGP